MTALLAKTIDAIPGLKLRSTPEDECLGMDEVEIGEFATDYIEIRRDVTDGIFTNSNNNFSEHQDPVAAGDRHGRPEIGFHQRSAMQNGNGQEHIEKKSSNVLPVQEKAEDFEP